MKYIQRQAGSRGFTLIELMIVVAIVAILASIAYPSYRESVLKGRRAEGRAALVELMQQQERLMTQTNAYRAFAEDATGTPFKTYSGSNASNAAYKLSAAACTGSTVSECIQLSARPVQSDPTANVLTLSSTGAKSCNGTAPSKCW